MTKQRIGIDLGGTKIEIILTQDNPLEVLHRKRVPTERHKGYDHILQTLTALIKEAQSISEGNPSIGMGIPGSVAPNTSLIRNANTQCLIGKPLQADLEKRINQKVVIENDANCLALSEALLGRGKEYEVVFGIILGTGVGGGIVFNQKIWSGHQGTAGEWGHSSIDFAGRECWCGRKGCAETYLSGPAIEKQYELRSGRYKSLKEIGEMAEAKQDDIAIDVIEETLEYFGVFMANLINSYDPSAIILGGGVSNLPSLYHEGLEKVSKHLFNGQNQLNTPILQNQLGDSSGVYGAALLGNT